MTMWFTKLHSAWQAMIVIGAAVLFGVGVGGWYTVLNELPDDVATNTQSILDIKNRVENVEQGQRGILKGIQLSNCLALAQVKGEPYQQCLDK
jgi:hypothetical protein